MISKIRTLPDENDDPSTILSSKLGRYVLSWAVGHKLTPYHYKLLYEYGLTYEFFVNGAFRGLFLSWADDDYGMEWHEYLDKCGITYQNMKNAQCAKDPSIQDMMENRKR